MQRRISRRTLLGAAGGLAVGVPAIAALIAACGDGGSGAGDAPDTASTTSEPDSPVRGGTLKVALTGDPPNLDLSQTTDSIVVLVTAHIYETLFTWDSEYRPVPLLAAGLQVSEGGLLQTLTLRQGVPFHNGEEMTAADVIASINRWGALSGLGEGLLEATDEIVEVDPHTIEFRMNAPFGTFAMALARQLQGCAIYPKSVLDRSDESSLAEYIGTGPYRFVEWQPDRRIRLERFGDYVSPTGDTNGYAGAKAQYFDAIDFIPVRNEATRIAGIQAGDYHYLETASPDQYESLQGNDAVAVDILPADA